MSQPSRRNILACAGWIGTGMVWTVAGGVPCTLGELGSAEAADPKVFHFIQMSDAHIGYKGGPYQDVGATLDTAIGRVRAAKLKPSFVMHTGDLTHTATPEQFDMATALMGGLPAPVYHVPGEHDVMDHGKSRYLTRFGRGTKGSGWYSFDDHGVHFIGLNNVMEQGSDKLWLLGPEQIAWLADDVRGLSPSMPIVVFAHVPLWTVYAPWGWGTGDAQAALEPLRRFGSVTLLNGHIHQIVQRVEGNLTFHTARSTAFPQPAPGTAPHPGPVLDLPMADVAKSLGISSVAYRGFDGTLAVTDSTLVDPVI